MSTKPLVPAHQVAPDTRTSRHDSQPYGAPAVGQADTSASSSIYRLEDVRHTYGTRTVLNVPRLNIRRGEILALVGPSGAGKSTLLRLLNFLETPTHGTVWFGDTPIHNQDQVSLKLRRAITMVFQRPVMRSTSVLKNAAYGLQLRGVPDARAIASEALDKLGLAPLAHKQAHTLSSGEMQRVALLRAILTEPAVLLLDEPTANLDPHNISVIEQAIIDLHKEQGTTLVLVTHNIFQARRLAERVALLLEGEIIEVSDVKTFFESPRDARTSAFLRGEIIY